tara:strand:+ start:13069 stop:13770 length:702 start_codon:yes stop_codon:yes gene_type:complete
MRIALFGYGKMGKTIERLAIERGHEIVAKIEKDTVYADITTADVAIDFSIPTEAFANIKQCFEAGVPIVCGTTGWLDQYDAALELCKEKEGGFIYASNYSLGVNLFFELNEQLAKMISKFDTYTVSMEEIHHTEKLDAPSGTAITLADGIIKNTTKNKWVQDVTNGPDEIPIVSKRIDKVPGTHSVAYNSIVDEIEIKHTAKNRDGFALGAIVAAEWLQDKKGVYTMKDVLGI